MNINGRYHILPIGNHREWSWDEQYSRIETKPKESFKELKFLHEKLKFSLYFGSISFIIIELNSGSFFTSHFPFKFSIINEHWDTFVSEQPFYTWVIRIIIQFLFTVRLCYFSLLRFLFCLFVVKFTSIHILVHLLYSYTP